MWTALSNRIDGVCGDGVHVNFGFVICQESYKFRFGDMRGDMVHSQLYIWKAITNQPGGLPGLSRRCGRGGTRGGPPQAFIPEPSTQAFIPDPSSEALLSCRQTWSVVHHMQLCGTGMVSIRSWVIPLCHVISQRALTQDHNRDLVRTR